MILYYSCLLWSVLGFTTLVAFIEAGDYKSDAHTPARERRALSIPLGIGAILQTSPYWYVWLVQIIDFDLIGWIKTWPPEILGPFLMGLLVFTIVLGAPCAIIGLCDLISNQLAPSSPDEKNANKIAQEEKNQ